jgi:hypothetical protein
LLDLLQMVLAVKQVVLVVSLAVWLWESGSFAAHGLLIVAPVFFANRLFPWH